MTPNKLLGLLDGVPDDLPLVFETPHGAIQGGYHVTELKLAQIESVDCAANRSGWSEATLQLYDGHGGAHMPVGKFKAVLAKSIAHLKGLGAADLTVECANGNMGLNRYNLSDPTSTGEAVTVALTPITAMCKPLAGATARASSCCGA